MAILAAFPGPEEISTAPKRKVMAVLRKASRNHLGEETYERLLAAAESTLALPGTLKSLKREVRLLLEQIELYRKHIHALEKAMTEVMGELPEAECLLSIPGVAPVSAAIFLGSIGDPQAYQSSRQILRLAGMNLVEDSSGIRQGHAHLSKSGRPLLRRQAFMLGLRAVRRDGIYRAQFEAMIARNGGRKMPAVVAIGRRMLRLMFSVARERRTYLPEPPQRAPVAEVAATV